MRDSNMGTDGVTVDRRDRLILFCDEDAALQRLRGVPYPEGCGTSSGDTAEGGGFEAGGPNPNDPNGNQRERVIRDNLNILKGPSRAPGGTPERDANARKRKSVSFEDDVIVYLFDQESPTSELGAPPPEGGFEDTGLEWEDDFSALEKQQASTPAAPPRRAAPPPRRFSLSQTCLFLTHVSESDLEL
ncbi:uncharacterized protein ACO6RY_16514 [Pungitius sinensis]